MKMKIADIDIDPFGEHDKMDEHPDEGETIAFTPGGVIEGGSTGNQKEKQRSEEEKLSQPDSKKYGLKDCIKSYLKALAKPQKHSILTIWKSKMESCTTKARACH